MEAKSKEDIISLLTVGGYAEHGEYLYKAGEVLDAMEEYSTQQNSELKEERDNWISQYGDAVNFHETSVSEFQQPIASLTQERDALLEHSKELREEYQTKLSSLREENERLRKAVDKAYNELKNPYCPIQSVITILRKAKEISTLHPSHNTE